MFLRSNFQNPSWRGQTVTPFTLQEPELSSSTKACDVTPPNPAAGSSQVSNFLHNEVHPIRMQPPPQYLQHIPLTRPSCDPSRQHHSFLLLAGLPAPHSNTPYQGSAEDTSLANLQEVLQTEERQTGGGGSTWQRNNSLLHP